MEGVCSREPTGTGKPHSGGPIPALDHQLCELEKGLSLSDSSCVKKKKKLRKAASWSRCPGNMLTPSSTASPSALFSFPAEVPSVVVTRDIQHPQERCPRKLP